ncbi:LRR receptor-like serine/threonine-protein kinase ERL1 isoform X1 [Populus alba x Populus x berolinensis]|nr:LRR receptor-like serine/threonine-protein kinase ERL1 isoform X1 [Populus alba x Populus x berolinensis]
MLKIYGFDHECIYAYLFDFAKQNMCFFVEKRLAERALKDLMTTLGFQQFSRSSCDSDFQGIKCNCNSDKNNSTVCHVTGLHLSTRELEGQINAAALASLVHLEEIDLSNNRLYGSIPDVTMGNLSSLNYLSLGYNMLSGQIPKELGNLSNLQVIELGSNSLIGELPGNYENFTSDQLMWFSVAGNRLTGQVPSFIANWTGLEYLTLSGNDFEGQLPLELLFNMSNLQYLFVSDVRSSAGFPQKANMTKIKYLVIRNCSISGEIPRYIGDWSSLKYLDLSFNNLSGGIPDSMKNLNLTKMFLTGNMLNGTVPSWLPHTIEDKAYVLALCSLLRWVVFPFVDFLN